MPAHKRKPNYNGATTMEELLNAVCVRGKLILQLHGKQFLRCTVRTSFIAW